MLPNGFQIGAHLRHALQTGNFCLVADFAVKCERGSYESGSLSTTLKQE